MRDVARIMKQSPACCARGISKAFVPTVLTRGQPILDAVKPGKTFPVQSAVEPVVMVRRDPTRIQAADFFDAFCETLRHAVQDRGRFVDVEEVTREHVAAEQESVAFAVETAVAGSMTRKMNDLKSAPKRKLLAVGQKFINWRGTIVEHRAPNRLQPPAPFADSLIGVSPVNVPLLFRVGINGCAAPLFEPGEIAGVVEMSVSQENGLERVWFETQSAHQSPDENRFAEQARVNHHTRLPLNQQVATSHDAANGVQTFRDVSHSGTE